MGKEFDFILKSSGVPAPIYFEYKKLLVKITPIVRRVEIYLNELEEGGEIDHSQLKEDKEKLREFKTQLEQFYEIHDREKFHKAEETYWMIDSRSQLNYSPAHLEAIIKKALGIKKIGE